MEFWIQGTELVYCDGDAGCDVPNHEAVVRAHILRDIQDVLRCLDDEKAAGIADLMERYIDEEIIDVIAVKCDLNDCLDFEWMDFIVQNTSYSRDVISSAFHNDFQGTLDLRLWACENLGWVRVVGRNVESWGFNRRQMKRAAWALDEIQQEWNYPQDGLWYWEDRKTGRTITLNVSQIENYNLTGV